MTFVAVEAHTRRRFLLGAAGAGLGLTACGTVSPLRPNRTAYPVSLAGTSPPASDLARLMAARARAVGMAPTVTALGSVRLADELRLTTRAGQYDPRSDTTPPVNRVVVLPTVGAAALEPLAAAALARGVHVVSYPTGLRHRSAAILVDQADAARELVQDAVRRLRARGLERGSVLLVLPPEGDGDPNPYATGGAALSAAVAAALTSRAPGLSLLATRAADATQAAAAVTALDPAVRAILVWDDAVALGAASALRGAPYQGGGTAGGGGAVYLGALGAPAVTSRATFAALRRGDLDAVAAVRVRDLADALVDVPRALLAGRPGRDVRLRPVLLTARSDALTAYALDYATTRGTTTLDHVALNPGLDPAR